MLNIQKYQKNNKWVKDTARIVVFLMIALPIFAVFNWFFNRYMFVFNTPIEIKQREEQYKTEVEFYELYGPYLDPNFENSTNVPNDGFDANLTPPSVQEEGLELEPLHSFNVPDDIKELVMLFANRANVPPAFAMGILLTENRSFNAGAVNVNSDGTSDYGLWQLNNIGEFDPVKNTERAADVLNAKRDHLVAMGVTNPSLGLLAESYNKGAAGALSLTYNPGGYATKVLQNATMSLDDPFVNNPFAYVNGL